MLPGHALFKETSATASVAAGGSLSMWKLGVVGRETSASSTSARTSSRGV
jgi:hypothetical protein